MTDQRIKLTAHADVNDKGEFEILAITAGTGNGWKFSAETLKASLALWDGTSSMIDHTEWDHMPSVLKLGGVCHSPTWNDEAQGVQVTLSPFGPMAGCMADIGRQWLALKKAGRPLPAIGFSGDIGFSANDKRDVIAINKVYQLDLVVDPARGGEFIAALQNRMAELTRREETMATPITPASPAGAPDAVNTEREQLNRDAEAVKTLLDVQKQKTEIAEEVEKMRGVRLQACGYLLDSGLLASKLPSASQEFVRKQFAGRVFEPPELTGAIDAQRDLIGKLTGPGAVAGPNRISAMFNGDDQLQAAVYDMFRVPRDPGTEQLKVHRLSGFRELFIGCTNDQEFTGQADYARALFQLTAADFPGLVKNAMNKALMSGWNQLGAKGYDWWKSIAKVEHFNDLKQVTWLITGTVGDLSTVEDGAEYTEVVVGDGAETSNFVTYGNYIGVTRRAIINDDTRKIIAIPVELGKAGIRKISRLCAAIFTDNSAVGPTLADGGALFNSTAVTTAGGHLNLLTTALGTTFAAWEAAAAAIYNQPMLRKNATGYYGTGDKQAIDPTFCLVPRALRGAANDLFIPRMSSLDNKNTENLYQGTVFPLTVPEWTDATDWAAVCDPALVPGLSIGEAFGVEPSIFFAGDELSPAMFANDELRFKVREEVAVGVCDFRGMHKNNVA